MRMRVLIFGGTAEARQLAGRLAAHGHEVTTSLAGRTSAPKLPPGRVRSGGFGDAETLSAYLRDEGFTHAVDATHPFAAKISASVAAACASLGLPLLRLSRPAWTRPDGVDWREYDSLAAAYAAISEDAVVFDTTGHRALDLTPRCRRVIRLIDPPNRPVPARDTIILDRPPYDLDSEIALMRKWGITHLTAKNAGGGQTRAKIDAAARLGLPVLMVRRPALPAVTREAETVEAAIAALQELSSP